MLEKGKRYFFETVTYHQFGTVEEIYPTHVKLSKATRVYDAGELGKFFATGKAAASEPLPDGIMIPLQGTAISPWSH